ncbi:hypothetical protein G6F56_003309 [Rhizopus delemar]|nr:hypothetical protein G6F56_003309 [Rhizopus delemar]
MTYEEVDRITTNLACDWVEEGKCSGVVSYINHQSVNFLITLMAMVKSRAVLFAISPRNSEAAIADLLEKTQSKMLFVPSKYKIVAQNAVAKVEEANMTIIPPYDFESLLKKPLNPRYAKILDISFSKEDLEKEALIIHTSGTTGFPKPIYLSNRYLLNVAGTFSRYKEQNPRVDILCQEDVFFSPAPLFHVSGLLNLFTTIVAGASFVFVENPIPSQTEIDHAFRHNKCTVMGALPFTLEEMVTYLKEKNDFSTVRHLKYILVGGALLKHEIFLWFKKNNVAVRSVYGSTETGVSMLGNMELDAENVSSLRSIYYDCDDKSYIAFEKLSEGSIHMYIRAGSPNLAIGVSNRPDGGFSSNDLFEEDPDALGYYNYLGRRDDILVMKNGEKTNPIPMENTIRQSPMVKQVAILGEGQQCTAALIQINTEYSMDYSPEEIILNIHQAVEQANIECPSHSIILPQMVKIIPFNKFLPVNDKGSLKRKMTEKAYEDTLKKMYKDFMEGPSSAVSSNRDGGIISSSSWSSQQIQSFLIENVAKILRLPESDLHDTSLSVFDLGLNSLTSIQLRNIIAAHFGSLPQSFVFQHPSVLSMKEALMSNRFDDVSKLNEKRYKQTQELAKSYIERAEKDFSVATNEYAAGKKKGSISLNYVKSAFSKRSVPGPKTTKLGRLRSLLTKRKNAYEKKDNVVMLSGATGSLGAFILRDLLKDPTVKKVYCLVRGSESDLFGRLETSFAFRNLDLSLLNSERVEALPMKLAEPYLGLTKERYDQLKDEVTIVQHCAWLLDFNMTIDHYDKECISPFYNLLKFAYRRNNPMHVHFISSVSASASLGSVVKEVPLPFDSHVTAPMGYAHSKFVCEILLNYLTKEKNFPCYIERVGQVSGDSKSGIWNTTEQVPIMFVSGGSLMHKMPRLSSKVDWVPVDYASATIVDIMLRTAHFTASQDNSIYHIVNSQTIDWSQVLEVMESCGMKFDVVDPAEWVKALSKDDTIPAHRLMPFYENSFKKDREFPHWQTEKTCQMAPVLSQSPVFSPELFEKYLKHWESVGFYSPPA